VTDLPVIAVVGGGMAGLGAAHALETMRREAAAAGDAPAFDWVLYERAEYFGGKVRTERVDGFVIEGGPDSFIVEKPWPLELARKVGVYERFLDSNEDVRKSYVFSRGRLHELPEGLILMVPTRLAPFALSSLISLRGKLRMGLDLLLPRGPAGRDESLGDFVRRRLGKEALAKVAEPIVAGIHAGDPEQMSVRATFPLFLDMEQQHRSLIVGMIARRRARAARAAAAGAAGPSFVVARGAGAGVAGSADAGAPGAAPRAAAGPHADASGAAAPPRRPRSYFLSFRTGLADLVDAVVADLPADRLHAGLGVASLAAEPPAVAGGSAGYRLRLADGSERVVAAVVLAGPAFASGELLGGLGSGAAADLLSIAYVSTATVSLAYRRTDVAQPLRGFGFVVPRAEERGIMAGTFSSLKFAGRAPDDGVLVRAFVGRAGRESAVGLPDDELVALVRRELASMVGLQAEPLFTRIFRWPRGMPQYRVGHRELIERIEHEVGVLPGIELAGGYLHGIGIGDCIREGAGAARRAAACMGDPTPVPGAAHGARVVVTQCES
jgi:protoporphyrinogen/coproporphyrinogen III oxidase